MTIGGQMSKIKFDVAIFRGTIAELNKCLDTLSSDGWTIVSVSLHSTLVYSEKPYDKYPQSDWLICANMTEGEYKRRSSALALEPSQT